MNETFEKLLEAIEVQGEVESDLHTLSNARSLRAAFYKWRRGLDEGSELRNRSERVMVNVRAGRIRFYIQGHKIGRVVEEILQRTA